MKPISSEFQAHLDSGLTTIASCCKITRTDGENIYLTDHVNDLSVDGELYVSAFGFTSSEVDTKSDLSTSNMEIVALIDSPKISSRDILVGLFDGAKVEFFVINYCDLSMGKIHHPAGIIGDITIENGRFTAGMIGIIDKLSQYYGSTTSENCPADLGDDDCGVDMSVAGKLFTGTTDTSSRDRINDSSRVEEDGFFNNGTLEFTDGDNNGVLRDIKTYAQGVFLLTLPVPFEVLENTTYKCTVGCDKTLSECISKYDNAIRFRGQPFMVKTDDLLKIGAQ